MYFKPKIKLATHNKISLQTGFDIIDDKKKSQVILKSNNPKITSKILNIIKNNLFQFIKLFYKLKNSCLVYKKNNKKQIFFILSHLKSNHFDNLMYIYLIIFNSF